jgi:3-isopropylmalate dehydrogenase
MAANKKLLILPGDGIGVEVMAEVQRVLGHLAEQRALRFDITTALVGGAAIDREGEPISEATMRLAHETDAVLFGAVGGPQWDKLPFEKKPERGLLRLRKELGLFANLRPALCFEPRA